MESTTQQPMADEVFKYVPTQCRETEIEEEIEGKKVPKKVAPTFKGHVILRQPTLEERYGRLAACEHLRGVSNTKFLLELVAASKDLWREVHLTHLASNKTFTSYDQLVRNPKCDVIVFEIAQMNIDGFDDAGLGN